MRIVSGVRLFLGLVTGHALPFGDSLLFFWVKISIQLQQELLGNKAFQGLFTTLGYAYSFVLWTVLLLDEVEVILRFWLLQVHASFKQFEILISKQFPPPFCCSWLAPGVVYMKFEIRLSIAFFSSRFLVNWLFDVTLLASWLQNIYWGFRSLFLRLKLESQWIRHTIDFALEIHSHFHISGIFSYRSWPLNSHSSSNLLILLVDLKFWSNVLFFAYGK